MQTVQLAIEDPAYEMALREALARSGPWRVESIDAAAPGDKCVLVMDEVWFSRMPQPLQHPERVVLLTRKEPANLSHAWEAGIVSLVSPDDPPGTVLLAIMAAALRVPKSQAAAGLGGGISPNKPAVAAQISPEAPLVGAKQDKTR
ncbi:MAG TPA: hypothetical protein VMU80_03710 [Bryobacteraceae bacterium]|nr:hypothetical protein [Bryobacteraceae bacterium]